MDKTRKLILHLIGKPFTFIYYYFKLCGHATMSLGYDEISKNYIWQKSIWGRVYNFVIIVTLILIDYHKSADDVNFVMDKESIFRSIVNSLNVELYVVSVAIILSYLCLKQAKMIGMIKEINDIEKNLIATGGDTHTTENNNLRRNVILIFAAHFFIHVERLAICSNFLYSMPLHAMCILLSLLILDSLALLYCVTLLFVRHLFRLTNDLLCANLAIPRSDDNQLIIVIENNVQHSQEHFQDMLKMIIQVHSKLCKFSQKLSHFGSLPALLYILHVFTSSSINFYNVLIDGIWNPNNHSIEFRVRLAFDVTCSLFYMVLLTNCATRATDESNRTREIIQDRLLLHTVEPAMKNQLSHIHRCLDKKTRRFNVFNMFPLDNTLLISMAATITTYLIILMQFYDAEKK